MRNSVIALVSALVTAFMMGATVMGGWPGLPVAGAAPSCADLGGTAEAATTSTTSASSVTGQMCHVHTANPTYTLDLRYPLDYPDQQTLTDYLVQNRDGFITVAQMPGARPLPYEMDATAELHRSGQPPKGTQSVVLKIFQDVGGPQPSTWYKTFTYDLGRNQPVTFDTLFAAGTKPLDAIYPIVQHELGRQTGLPGALIQPGSGLDPSHYQNFAITDDELIFYFAPGELLPLSAGATSAHVARTAIPPLAL